ncbi:MAG TPA: phage protease [Holophaga sp.]|nr:phage protease [Holophaga sp.]
MPALLKETSHAAQLPQTPGEPPVWIHTLPAGTFRGRDGRGPYLVQDAQAVIKATLAYAEGADLVVDYEHQTLTAEQHSGPVPAAGWMKAYEAREDGIWAQVDWTPAASSALVAKEYRYFSPVFDYDTRTGAVVRLKLGALTNVPNLQLQAAASRQGDPMNELMERLCYLLNLPLTTTPEEMAGQLDKLKEMLTGSNALAAASVELGKTLGMPQEAPALTVLQEAQARIGQAPDPTKWVPKAQHDQVAQALSKLQADAHSGQATREVEAAMSAGKIPPALKEWAMDYASRSLDDFKKYVANAPVIATANSQLPPPPGGGSKTLTPEEETVAHAMGLSPEAFLSAKKED